MDVYVFVWMRYGTSSNHIDIGIVSIVIDIWNMVQHLAKNYAIASFSTKCRLKFIRNEMRAGKRSITTFHENSCYEIFVDVSIFISQKVYLIFFFILLSCHFFFLRHLFSTERFFSPSHNARLSFAILLL